MTDTASAWTPERVAALAPDASAAKAGQGLATPRKWASLGADGQTLWGECQGSGASPYQVRVDTAEPAWRCSCPSRKLPCKHALGLFLLFAAQPAALAQGDPPPWVAEWLAMRGERAEKRAARAAEEPARAAAPQAQARRAAQREDRVAAGLAELELWLADLVRQGLAAAQSRPAAWWGATAARLVDAQAPGAARLVRGLGRIPATGEGWPERMLEALGRLRLLVEAGRRLDVLPEPVREDVRAALGWTRRQDEVLALGSVRDRWLVLGQRVDDEDRQRVQRTWLRGEATGRDALVLAFAAAGQPLDTTLVAGTVLDAELGFHPGSRPLRAVVGERHAPPAPLLSLPGYATVRRAVAAYADALSGHPWLEQFPLPLAAIPVPDGAGWLVRDAEGHALPVDPRFDGGWELLALSGGHPVALFGEWDGDALLPLGALAEGRYVSLWRGA